MMGSLINEGLMYYLAPNQDLSKIIKVFLDGLQKVQSDYQAQFIFLRDFDKKDENHKISYPATSRVEGIAPSQYGTKGLLGDKFADIEEKYDLTKSAEGFAEKDADGEDIGFGEEGVAGDDEEV